jgi:hypothetical protein
MRILNKKYNAVVLLAVALSILFIALDVVISGISGSVSAYFDNNLLTISGVSIILIVILLGNQQFEYDSDGEVLIFKSQNVFLGGIFPRLNQLTEFPKRKLHSYRVSGVAKKTLHIYISSKNHSLIHRKYNITYLNSQEKRNLLRSLDRTLKNNLSESETQ